LITESIKIKHLFIARCNRLKRDEREQARMIKTNGQIESEALNDFEDYRIATEKAKPVYHSAYTTQHHVRDRSVV